MGGTRYLQLDGAEVHKSRGSTTVMSLTAAGHILQFRVGTDGPVGFVKILPFGATGFSYHCFLVRPRHTTLRMCAVCRVPCAD